jgi:hypothetical protein
MAARQLRCGRGMTSILILFNKAYQVDGAGIRVTGDLIPPNDEGDDD